MSEGRPKGNLHDRLILLKKEQIITISQIQAHEKAVNIQHQEKPDRIRVFRQENRHKQGACNRKNNQSNHINGNNISAFLLQTQQFCGNIHFRVPQNLVNRNTVRLIERMTYHYDNIRNIQRKAKNTHIGKRMIVGNNIPVTALTDPVRRQMRN